MTHSDQNHPQKFTVLIVDDSEGNRLLLRSQLRMEGYHTLEASSGEAGLAMAHQHAPDLILLDVMMPNMNGFELCAALKIDPDTEIIPVIMMTALRDVQYRIKGIEAGADEFLSRPHVREELFVRVRTLIEYKHTQVRLQEERNRLETLYSISQSLNGNLKMERMVHEILGQAKQAVGAHKATLVLVGKQNLPNKRFTINEANIVMNQEHIAPDIFTHGFCAWLLKNQHGDIINNVDKDNRWLVRANSQKQGGAAMGVPLSRGKQPTGMLILTHPSIGYFTPAHLSLLETIAAQISASLENAALFAEVDDERRKLESVLQQTADAIVLTNENQQITMINQKVEQIFELNAAAVIGKKLQDVGPFHLFLPLLHQSIREARTQEFLLSNGLTMHTSISPIHGVGYAIVMQDITAMKESEQVRLAHERSEKEIVRETFSRYMGPEIVDHVLSSEPGLMGRRERRSAVVMYADLRNWTSGMMTRLEPDEAIEQLNEFFAHMMEIALANNGTVFELTGDEILVGFNVPFDQSNATYLAVKTAVTMQHRFNELRQRWYSSLGTQVGLGIGIDQGQVVIGNVGAESRMSFRMVGEVMSRAHRLVDIAKDSEIAISAEIYNTIHHSNPELIKRVQFTTPGLIMLKGIPDPQSIYICSIPRPPLK